MRTDMSCESMLNESGPNSRGVGLVLSSASPATCDRDVGTQTRALQLVGTCRLMSAYSEINILGRHRGSACVLLNLWQPTRTGFKGARTSSASQCWDNR